MHVEWLERENSEIIQKEHVRGETQKMLGGLQVFLITLWRLATMNYREAG